MSGEKLRPDILFSLSKKRTRRDEHGDLAEEDDGFVCHNCGWRSLSIPLNMNSGEPLENVCPECEVTDVENLFSTHVDEVREIYNRLAENEEEFIAYSDIESEFPSHTDRLDEVANHLLTQNDAYVVFDDGEPLINIVQ